jgi:hypothetical protein
MKGADAGTVSKITMTGESSFFGINSGQGGASPAGNGGAGGAISDISGTVGILYIDGGAGGDSAAAMGGAGASVSKVDISSVGLYVRAIAAGNGGTGTSVEGQGGSISDVKVAGDIGDFALDFDTANIDNSGMGGLIAGQGGTADSAFNGSIASVSAYRIAAIVAGRVDGAAVGALNDVTKILGISAGVVGADINHDGLPTDGVGGTWSLLDTHALDDGVVIVNGSLGDGYSGTAPLPGFLFDV